MKKLILSWLLKKEDISWVVNEDGELGVNIGRRQFYLYKGDSVEYSENEKMSFRAVGKREFGESCISPQMHITSTQGVK